MVIYVIGVPQAGGCWLWNEKCYKTREEADAALKVIWDKDQAYADKSGTKVSHTTKIFHLYTE